MNEKTKKILKVLGIGLGAIVALLLFAALKNGRNVVYKGQDAMTGVGLSAPSSVGVNQFGVNANYSREMKSASVSDSIESVAPNMISPEMAAGGAEIATDKKVIKTGNLSLKVSKAEESAKRIADIARENGGAVFSSNFYERTRGSRSGSITVKVPFAKFENAFEEIKKTGTQVISESTNAQDVTEEYTDLEARLRNKRSEEESFVAILSRAGEIDDVLKATREVARVRGEIEQLQGRIKFLNSQTDMSTITVQLSEDVEIAPVTEGWRPWQVVKQSVKLLIKNSQSFVDSAIEFIIVTLPALIVYLLVLWIVWITGRKIYKKFKKPEQLQ